MRLDRNRPFSHGNKYALLKNRVLEATRDSNGHFPPKISEALMTLIEAGILDWGCTPQTEFFVIRLKDKYAPMGLHGYAIAALQDDPEYSMDVKALAEKSLTLVSKRPD